MNYLQYTSNEMYSSTDLIRKSKSIFDKLNKKEIEKAIILRDGKPSFMLLDFETYENIMIEYIKLKSLEKSSPDTQDTQIKDIVNENSIEEATQESTNTLEEAKQELHDDDVKRALEEIEKLNFDAEPVQTKLEEKKEQPLKDFWE